ncbi:MAG: glycoside hydrolase family 44 protein, partial [Myxococcota bacterium]
MSSLLPRRRGPGRFVWCALFALLLCSVPGACACWERGRKARAASGTNSLDQNRERMFLARGRRSEGPEGIVRLPGDPGEVDVVFSVHGRRDARPISSYIYGVNHHPGLEEDLEGLGMLRLGGNRWTAYNWTNNASNAGSDYNHQNDGWLGGGEDPGGAVWEGLCFAKRLEAAALVTIPITDWVAADKEGNGDVAGSGNDYLQKRFVRSLPRKTAAFSFPPEPGPEVYQDEMVHWLGSRCREKGCPPVFYALDNEPGLWSTTHPRIRKEPVTYSELVERSVAYASAIKDVDSEALLFGPVSYGWADFVSLQNAPDARGRDFLEHYLRSMREASEEDGRRLLDVLTIHWYPEALGRGERITGQGTSPAVVAARVQAPRSLWDPRYTEDSWICR